MNIEINTVHTRPIEIMENMRCRKLRKIKMSLGGGKVSPHTRSEDIVNNF